MDGSAAPHDTKAAAACAPEKILEMADAYADAAEHLFDRLSKGGQPETRAPAQLCALHAIELYLHAFLRFRGAAPNSIKNRHHSLDHEEFCQRLELDAKTRDHLRQVTERRDYHLVRYKPEALSTLSQMNRMQRTLQLVREARDRIPFDV